MRPQRLSRQEPKLSALNRADDIAQQGFVMTLVLLAAHLLIMLATY